MRIKLDKLDEKIALELWASSFRHADVLLKALIKLSGSLTMDDESFKLVNRVLDFLIADTQKHKGG